MAEPSVRVMCRPSDANGESATEFTGATLAIDLKALQDNWRKLGQLAAPAECGAAVKGDAYGIGLAHAAGALWAAGCRTFFVALPGEGITLHGLAPEATIYVLNGLLPGSGELFVEHGLRPALSSLDEVAEWAACCRRLDRRLPAALHIDTGLNRLGLTAREVETLARSARDLEAFRTELVMSHLACADEPNHPMNAEQLDRFERLRRLLPAAKASLANSPGILAGSGYRFDLVRPGVALYGGNPFSGRANPMKPVVRLYGAILQVREVPRGQTVGYGATWKAERPSRVAVIGAGYYDGYARSLGAAQGDDRAHVFIGGQFAPLVGRVSMDLIAADVTDVPAEKVRRGAMAELIGDHVSLDELARRASTVPYEILTRLGSRYARVYSAYRSH